MIRRLRRFLCGLSGHTDALRHFEQHRMSLKCTCGWETTGWDLRTDARPRPARMLRMPSVKARRAA